MSKTKVLKKLQELSKGEIKISDLGQIEGKVNAVTKDKSVVIRVDIGAGGMYFKGVIDKDDNITNIELAGDADIALINVAAGAAVNVTKGEGSFFGAVGADIYFFNGEAKSYLTYSKDGTCSYTTDGESFELWGHPPNYWNYVELWGHPPNY